MLEYLAASVRHEGVPPSDITVHLASDMPSWLAPSVAAAAAILASFLTWLGARLNDGTKAKREKRERWDNFIIEQAAILQRSCEAAIKKRQAKASRDEVDGYMSDALMAYEKLSIVAPKAIVQTAENLYVLTIQDTMAKYDPIDVLRRHRNYRRELVETIRQYIGVPELKWTPPAIEDVRVQSD